MIHLIQNQLAPDSTNRLYLQVTSSVQQARDQPRCVAISANWPSAALKIFDAR
jgi:hypothetical protein